MFLDGNFEIHIYHPRNEWEKALNPELDRCVGSPSSSTEVSGCSLPRCLRKFMFYWDVLIGTSDFEWQKPGCILKAETGSRNLFPAEIGSRNLFPAAWRRSLDDSENPGDWPQNSRGACWLRSYGAVLSKQGLKIDWYDWVIWAWNAS